MGVNVALPDLIVDSVIISLINRSMVTLDDFIFSSNGCALKKKRPQGFLACLCLTNE